MPEEDSSRSRLGAQRQGDIPLGQTEKDARKSLEGCAGCWRHPACELLLPTPKLLLVLQPHPPSSSSQTQGLCTSCYLCLACPSPRPSYHLTGDCFLSILPGLNLTTPERATLTACSKEPVSLLCLSSVNTHHSLKNNNECYLSTSL